MDARSTRAITDRLLKNGCRIESPFLLGTQFNQNEIVAVIIPDEDRIVAGPLDRLMAV